MNPSRRINPHESTAALAAALWLALGGLGTVAAAEVNETEPNDSLATAQVIPPSAFTLDSDPDIAESTTLPHVTVVGTGNDTYDYYQIEVGENDSRLIVDIDYGQNSGGAFDPYVALFRADGTVAGSDDDGPTTDGAGGSVSGHDSYLDLPSLDAGTYTIGVARFSSSGSAASTGGFMNNNFVTAGGTYEMQISTMVPVVEEPFRGSAWTYSGSRSAPIPNTIALPLDLAAIDSGSFHNLGLRKDGSVVGWGWDHFNQLTIPAGAQIGVEAIIARGNQSLALREDGRVVAWGMNDYGQADVPVEAQSGVTAIAASRDYSLALKENGHLYFWGRGITGASLNNWDVKAIAAGHKHWLAIKNDGSLVAWGDNLEGQSDVPAEAASDVKAITAGLWYSAALKNDGSVVVWGTDDYGFNPVPTEAQSGVTAIAGGHLHIVALKDDGSVIAWGWNDDGQCTVPTEAQTGITAVAAGYRHSSAIKEDGSSISWGNTEGTIPALVQDRVTDISVGEGHTVALTVDGEVIAWGNNDYGETTVPAAAQSGVTAVAAGGVHTLALKAGAVLAWGSNIYGNTTISGSLSSGVDAIDTGVVHSMALKNGAVITWGSSNNGLADVPVSASSGVTAIAAGDYHNVALTNSGSVVAWGEDAHGRTTVPPEAQGGVTAIAAGGSHTLALKDSGSVIAWGDDDDGQSTVPPEAQSGVTAIAAGQAHSAALKEDGSVITWGYAREGQSTVPWYAQRRVSGITAGGNATFYQMDALDSPNVRFSSLDLETAVRSALGLPSGFLTEADVETLENLNLRNAGITDLSGLEFATNLRILDIRGNSFSDIDATWAILNGFALYCLYTDLPRPGGPGNFTTDSFTDTSGNPFEVYIDALNFPNWDIGGLDIDIDNPANLTALQTFTDAGVNIDNTGTNIPPVAVIEVYEVNHRTGEVYLDPSGSIDVDGTIVSLNWSWDGGSDPDPYPLVILPTGSTEITLTVTDDDGASSSDTVEVEILPFLEGDYGTYWLFSDSNGLRIHDAEYSGSFMDPFDGASVIEIDGIRYTGGIESNDASTITGESTTVSGVDVSVAFELIPGRAAVRTMVTLENNSGGPLSPGLSWLSNWGSNQDTTIHSTSSGDLAYDTTDVHCVTSDTTDPDNTGVDPANISYWGDGTAQMPNAVSGTVFEYFGTEGLGVTYNLALAAGERVRFVFGHEMSYSGTAGIEAAQTAVSSGDFLAGLSPTLLAEVVNWGSLGTPSINTLEDELDTPASEGTGVSLREAIRDATPGANLVLDPSLAGQTITLTMGQLLIDKNLTIDASALPGGLTIDANQLSRVMEVTAGTTVVLHSLAITGGRTADGRDGSADDLNAGDSSDGGGIHNSGDLTLHHCTVSNNSTGDGGDGGDPVLNRGGGGLGGSGGFGGGIHNSNPGSLTLHHCSISQNTAGEGGEGGLEATYYGTGLGVRGGDGGSGGGISNEGILALDNCSISESTAGDGGDSGWDYGSSEAGGSGGFGGGIHSSNLGNLTLHDCSISGNSTGGGGDGSGGGDETPSYTAGDGGSGGDGGGIYSAGEFTLHNCTVSGNTTGHGGYGAAWGYEWSWGPGAGGDGGDGGGISNAGTATLLNCTVSANRTGYPGFGGYELQPEGYYGSGGGIHTSGLGNLTVEHCTVSQNSTERYDGFPASWGNWGYSASGGGIYAYSPTTISNTIVAGNAASSATGDDLVGSSHITATGVNLIGDLSGSGLSDDANVNVGDPLLAPLGDHGGPTRTMPLLFGSPAIDAAGVIAMPPATDQRGSARPVDGDGDTNAVPDIGAVEYSLALDGPEIVVEQPDGTPLVNGSGPIDFGTVAIGDSVTQTFTVRNTGVGDLTNLQVGGPAGPLAEVFINELHYDNAGTDVGEFVEVAGPAGTNLSAWSLVFYSGTSGLQYGSVSLSGSIPDEGNGAGAISFAVSGIQNGPNDGIALYDGTQVVEFISYEGVSVASDGVAAGMTSTNIAVFEDFTSPVGHSLQRTGSGSASGDFSWVGPFAASPGQINGGQQIVGGRAVYSIQTGEMLLSVAPGESTTFSVVFSPPATSSHGESLSILSNDPDDSPFVISLTGTGATARQMFDIAATAAGLSGAGALPEAISFNDGVDNLLKYAFNMNLADPDTHRMVADGDSGMPGGRLVEYGGQTYWRVQYVRRIGSGLIYTAKKSTTLEPGSFIAMTGVQYLENIDTQWDRVTIDEPTDPAHTPRLFSRVEVALP